MAVYPRWRGEHSTATPVANGARGLSPLARGTRLNMYIYSLPYPVYPRWRGEHRLCLRLYRWWRGLSPLARGTPERGAARHAKMRFIPAGAGNTCFRKSMDYCYSVYPRWRGEHCSVVFILPACHGLSPLARGTLPYRLPDIIFLRFIPAGAGNTCCSSWWSAAIAVYPRWRGEHNVRLSPLCVVAGLSPLARGTLHGFGFLFDGRRFIPAGAGNTLCL